VQINTKEHYDVIEEFEKQFSYLRHDKEDKEMWKMGAFTKTGKQTIFSPRFASDMPLLGAYTSNQPALHRPCQY